MRRTSEHSQNTQEGQDGSPISLQPTASEVVMSLIATSHRLQRVLDARLSRKSGVVSLSGPRLRLLLAVEEAGRLRMGDLAADLGITPRTVTTLVDALRGYSWRKPVMRSDACQQASEGAEETSARERHGVLL